jgi:hypothetical protein
MDNIPVKYRLAGEKAVAPQTIRMSIPGWVGEDQPRQNGSEPQLWHCPPFVEGATQGLELVYPYETECRVFNPGQGQDLIFEFDFQKEPGAKLDGTEFVGFHPKPSRYYLFKTQIDVQSPPGTVLRTQPHPRFYADDTGTVPLAVIGQVQTEWWPKKMFVVFKAPPPGERHVFRKGEPYAQIIFVPHRVQYEPVLMTPEEANEREQLDLAIMSAGSFIARTVWHNPGGEEFKDHYKVMGRAFVEGGHEGVKQAIVAGLERQRLAVPEGLTLAQYLALAEEHRAAGRMVEAREVYLALLDNDQNNAEAHNGLGRLAMEMGVTKLALSELVRASQLRPRSAGYRVDVGRALREGGRHAEARKWFESALKAEPGHVGATAALAEEKGAGP